MSEAWAEVAFSIPTELVDQLAEFLVELSGTGVCIDNQTLDTFSLDNIREEAVTTVKAYFPAGPDLESQVASAGAKLRSMCAAFPGFTVSAPRVSLVKQEDWATSWMEHFHPSPVGRRLILKPSWEEFAATDDQVVIEIDPGMAFGTGTHPTTRLCLEALERIFDREPSVALPPDAYPPSLLDVGTGSGVLAIAARKLGAGKMVALDIDAEAVRVALENLANNGIVNDLEVATTSLSVLEETFSLVLANILAEDLIRMAPDLTARTVPGGLIILSGILIEREQGVMAAFSSCGLKLVEATHREEWSCLIYRRES